MNKILWLKQEYRKPQRRKSLDFWLLMCLCSLGQPQLSVGYCIFLWEVEGWKPDYMIGKPKANFLYWCAYFMGMYRRYGLLSDQVLVQFALVLWFLYISSNCFFNFSTSRKHIVRYFYAVVELQIGQNCSKTQI